MSMEKKRHEAERWLVTARDDLEAADILQRSGKYALACFHCQQSAEKALKALWYYSGKEPWGHSVRKLITGTHDQMLEVYKRIAAFGDPALILDRYYIPTRYPDGLPDITPPEAYSSKDADEAIKVAGELFQIAAEIIKT